MSHRLLPMLLAAAALAAGCGSSSPDTETSAQPSATASPAATATPGATAAAAAGKPTVRVPRGAPPKKLVKKDLKVGNGPVARPGQTVTVQYVGVAYKTRKQFDASWDRGQPFTFALGAGRVIQGWDRGVAGMRVGGRRELIIPPDLAYGANGPPPIGKNATLVFVIDLLAVQ